VLVTVIGVTVVLVVVMSVANTGFHDGAQKGGILDLGLGPWTWTLNP
jgi:hypothetical protein